MRAFLFKFAGLALYIHDLQPGMLTLLHERPNKEPKVHILDDEDFEDSADEIDPASVQCLESRSEASTVGLSLGLIKNDGILKITYEGKHGLVANWTFEGLNETRMVASAFTQTDPEVSKIRGDLHTMPLKLSISTIQTMATNPRPERIIQSLRSGFSVISNIATRPISGNTKPKEEVQSPTSSVTNAKDLKCKAAPEISTCFAHKLARSEHKSPLWPNHLFMACYRTQPVHNDEVGILHIDLVAGTVWFEGWSGKAHISQQTYVRKQVDLRSPSTSVGYFHYGGMLGEDFSTHQLRLSKINKNQSRVVFFSADCTAPGYRIWGSDVYNSIDPIPHYSALDWNLARNRQRSPISIPDLPAETTKCYPSPAIIIDALVHCIDRSSRRQAIHDPVTERKLFSDLERGFRYHKQECLSGKGMLKWITAIQEIKKKAKLKKVLKALEEVQKKASKKKKKKTKVVDEVKVKVSLKRKLEIGEGGAEKQDKKAKVENCTANGTTEVSTISETPEAGRIAGLP